MAAARAAVLPPATWRSLFSSQTFFQSRMGGFQSNALRRVEQISSVLADALVIVSCGVAFHWLATGRLLCARCRAPSDTRTTKMLGDAHCRFAGNLALVRLPRGTREHDKRHYTQDLYRSPADSRFHEAG